MTGRTEWLRVLPPVAPAEGLRRLSDRAEQDALWRRAETRAQSSAIGRLAQQLADDVEKLAETRLERARRMRARLVARYRKNDRRLAKAAAAYRKGVAAEIALARETVRRMRRRELWDKILIVSSLPLFAAYGQRGHPFGVNNLTLLIALLVWLVGDEVSDAVFRSPSKESPYPLRDADSWSYIAPAGNLLAGWWLMDGLQHERFVVGFTREFAREESPVPASAGMLRHVYVSEVPLSKVVAPRHFEEFQTFREVPVVAILRTATLNVAGAAVEHVSAIVNEVTPGLVTKGKPGILLLGVTIVAPDPGVAPAPSVVDQLEVAWMVDTQDPQRTTST